MPDSEASDPLVIPPPNFSSIASRLSFSLLASANIQSLPSLLAVFPRSRLAARRVALRIKSGRLVRLPLASASRTASTLSLAGRLCPASSPNVVLGAVALSAPPFSKPPRIWSMRGSMGGEPATFRDGMPGTLSQGLGDFISLRPPFTPGFDKDSSEDDGDVIESGKMVAPPKELGCGESGTCLADKESPALPGNLPLGESKRGTSLPLIVVKVGLVFLPTLTWRTMPPSSGTPRDIGFVGFSSSDGVSPSPSSR